MHSAASVKLVVFVFSEQISFFHIVALPPLEPKSAPDLLFLKILNGANTTFHLMEKHFTDYILRPVG